MPKPFLLNREEKDIIARELRTILANYLEGLELIVACTKLEDYIANLIVKGRWDGYGKARREAFDAVNEGLSE